VRKSRVYKLFHWAVGDRRWTTVRWCSEMVVALSHRERQAGVEEMEPSRERRRSHRESKEEDVGR
jgi:hypothetical protein